MRDSKAFLPSGVISTVCLTGIILNLLIWLIPIVLISLVLAIFRVFPSHTMQISRRVLYDMTDVIYRSAVGINNYWMYRVVRIPLVVHGATPANPDEPLVVVSNHRSWFDILAAQTVITSAGPRISFLVKQELIWVPVVGWICLALNFPLLKRGGPDTREQDRQAVSRGMNLQRVDNRRSGAMLSYVEGTRFIAEKQPASSWQHLLPPRAGGLSIICHLIAPSRVLDLTMVYPGSPSFWQLLSGRTAPVHVYIDWWHTADLEDLPQWLHESWDRKDARIAYHAE